MLTMQTVTSSNIAKVGYDPEKKELHIEFHNGGVYVYSGVEASVYDNLMHAPSIGSFFYANIQRNYSWRKA